MKYQDLIGQINADINTNGNNAITGAKMNSVLNEMVSVLGDGFRISGEITPQSEAPTDPENGMCYIAATSGSYVNFGNIGVNDDEIAFIYYDSDNESWNKMRWSRKDFGLVVVDVSTLSSFGEDEMDEVRKSVCFIIRNDAEGVVDRLFVKDRSANGFIWFYAAPMLSSDSAGDLVLDQGCIRIRSTAEGGRYPYETVSIGYELPTKGNVSHALSLKADKVSDATQGNLAALDSSGNLTDSGIPSNNIVQKSQTSGLLKNDGTVDTTQYGTYSKPSGGIPATDLESAVQNSLGKADTAVQSVTVGTTTTGNPYSDASVTNSGTSTSPVLNFTIPRGADGQDGADAVNPFKGWYSSDASLPANPVVGDYAYVKGATESDPAAIYECTTAGTWSNSGRTADTSNVQTFASGEEVNEVHIIDDFHTGGSDNVLSAEMGKLIKEEFSELTIDNDFILYRDQSAIDQNIVVGNPVTTEIVSSSYFKIIRYNVDRSNYYYGSGPAHASYDRNVYYWADAEENLLKKETLRHSTSAWTNYLLVPPPGAKYLYVNEIRSSTYASQYQIKVYEWKTIDQDKTHLCDPNAKDNALAVDVMPMKAKLEGVTASEVKAIIGEQISGYINGNGAPAAVSSGSTTTYVVIALNNAKSVRLLGSTNSGTGTNYSSYAFWNSATYVDSNTVVEAHNWDVREGSTNYAKEYKLIVPDGATHIAVTLSTNTNQPNFYCYLQNGKTVKDEINSLQQELFDSLYEKKPVVTIPVVNPDTESEFKSISNAVVGNQITNYYADSTTQKIWRYEIEEGHSYFLSGYWRISSSYTIASWTDINGIILKIEPLHGGDTAATALTLTDEEIIAPDGAKYLYILNRVVSYLTNPVLKDWQKKDFTPETKKKQVRILAIGNSHSQDALAYVPYILPNISDDIDLTVGILYKDGASLEDHWSAWEGNTDAYTFWISLNGANWTSLSSKSIRYALDNYEWDIIVTQQKSSDSYYPDDAYDVNHQPYLNNLLNAIQNYVDYPVKYAWMLIQSRPGRGGTGTPNYTDAQILSNFNNIVANAQTVLDETLCEAVIPWGTAIQNARTISSICELGHYADQSAYSGNTSGKGYLTYDGVHLQEGLPCQIAAYSVILSILGLCGESYKSIIGETTIADATWLQEKTIPGGNGVSIGATKENVMLGQKCAVMAFKKPYAVTDMNYIVNPV